MGPVLLAVSVVVVASCSSAGSESASSESISTTNSFATSTAATTTTSTMVEDETIDINHVQVIGSHNSYHLKPQQVLFDGITGVSEELASDIEYSHRPLTEQLEMFGIRQFEIDVLADPDGGLYTNRAANPVVGLDEASGEPALDEPGYKVLHTQDYDYETTCLTLVACLQEIEEWSSAHPAHLPIMIMLEIKEESVPEAAAAEGIDLTIDLPWATPVKITPDLLDDLDSEIRSVFGPERIIEPDDVRGDAETLEGAVLGNGWPALADSRGKVMFSMTDGGEIRDMYVDGHPSLEGRPIFTDGTPGNPDAAFMRFDEADDPGLDAAAAAGYLIRTRTDSPTDDARADDTTTRDLALAGGAHFLSTDYYEPSAFFDSAYVVQFPDGAVARCNPVTAPPSCADATLAE